MVRKTWKVVVLCLPLLMDYRGAVADDAADSARTPETSGMADLRRALQQFRTHRPLALNVQFNSFGRTGDDSNLQEHEGVLRLRLEDSEQGLRLHYAPELLAQLKAEEMAKAINEDVKNSALNAIGPFDYWEWRELLYPAEQLELMLAKYQFLGESAGSYEGRPARLLRFSQPKEKIDKRYRRYVRKYHSHLQLWIDDQGIPLASQLEESGLGRVFVVIRFRFKNAMTMEYQTVGERLITRRREVRESNEGSTMHNERHFISQVSVVGK